jgi:hypothetical protein
MIPKTKEPFLVMCKTILKRIFGVKEQPAVSHQQKAAYMLDETYRFSYQDENYDLSKFKGRDLEVMLIFDRYRKPMTPCEVEVASNGKLNLLNTRKAISNLTKKGELTKKFHILEHPDKNEEYIAGIDPIPFQQPELKPTLEQKFRGNELQVMKCFEKSGIFKAMTPHDVGAALGKSLSLITIRSIITNLTKKGELTKLKQKKMEKSGVKNSLWTIKE